MKILVLVIVSFDKPVYYDMLRLWRERILNNRFDSVDGCVTDRCVLDVWFIQCKSDAEWIGDIVNDLRERSSLRAQPDGCKNPPFLDELHSQSQSLGSQSLGSQSLCDRFELDIANKTLFIRGDECLIPGILHKTVEALSYFLRERSSLIIPPYNFVWRTNLSSVLDFEGLQRYLGTINLSGFYGGYVGKTVGKALSEATLCKDIWFASGAGFLMSRDVAEYLVLNKDSLRWDLIDDVAIGALLEPRYGIVPIERCWIQSGEEMVGGNGVFHYRCESYQHLRTVEFMQYVVRGLSK
jgi:hypothetical protein